MLAFLCYPLPFRFSLGVEGRSSCTSDCAGPKASFFASLPPVTHVCAHPVAALSVDLQS